MTKINSKVKYIIISIVVVVLVILIFLLVYNNKKVNQHADFSRMIDRVDYDKDNVVINNDNVISDKYNISSNNIVQLSEDVTFEKYTGKLLYIRSNKMKANIFQIKNKVAITKDNSAPLLAQVDTYMTLFKNQVLKYLELDINSKPLEEDISSGKSNDIPLVEKIYVEKRTYSLTYKVDDILYDVNFYMNDDYFVCEIVRFL